MLELHAFIYSLEFSYFDDLSCKYEVVNSDTDNNIIHYRYSHYANKIENIPSCFGFNIWLKVNV